MFKLGIYIEDVTPEEGGASNLLKTIQNEIETVSHKTFSYVILHRGRVFDRYKRNINGIEYINIVAAKRNYYPVMLIRKIKDMFFSFVRRLLFFNEKHDCISYIDRVADKENIDLIWFTFPILEKLTTPYVFTIWDLGHRVLPAFPEVNDNWDMRERVFRSMIYHATYLLIGNESGKKEILDNYCVAPEKIIIAPFPVSSFCDEGEKEPEYRLPSNYFFYPAQFWPHKNHIVILKAVAYLKNNRNILSHVIFTGSDKGYKDIVKENALKLGIDDLIHFIGFISSEEIKYLYTHADGMIFASCMGPNNLPPIEAAYLGCPVIISDLPGHREQLGDAALYFPPTDAAVLAKSMEILLKDRTVVADLKNNMKKINYTKNYLGPIIDIFEKFNKMSECWKII